MLLVCVELERRVNLGGRRVIRTKKFNLDPDKVARVCHHQRGVSADGFMRLIPCGSGKADWAWDFYNSDGSYAEMCGNGARCFARFVQKVTGLKRPFTFETGAGVITANCQGDLVTISLTQPKDMRLDQQVTLSVGARAVHSVNTGVPHAVVFVP